MASNFIHALQAEHYYIDPRYSAREEPVSALPTTESLPPPYVYPFAAYLAERYGCTHIIDLGCGHAKHLAPLAERFQIIGVDRYAQIVHCRATYPQGQWIVWNFDQPGTLPIDPAVLSKAVIVCSYTLEEVVDPAYLLDNLHTLLDHAPVCIVATPDRERVHGYEHFGPPTDPLHVREWSLRELCNLLEAAQCRVEFQGYTYDHPRTLEKTTAVCILSNHHVPRLQSAPEDFTVTAFLYAYNEEDVIEGCIKRLVDQGIQVYFLDNWSTDRTAEIARRYLGKGVVAVESYPAAGPQDEFSLHDFLVFIEALVPTFESDWFLTADADEVRCAPWPGIRLKDAFYHVDVCGFNVIDLMVINFHPVENLPDDVDPFDEMIYYELGRNIGYFRQQRAWKNLRRPFSLAAQFGHEIKFEGKRVFPYKFLLRHYPIRSQPHGERKVLQERKTRWAGDQQKWNINRHYSGYEQSQVFLYNRLDLELFEEAHFAQKYLIERLSSVAIPPYSAPIPAKAPPFLGFQPQLPAHDPALERQLAACQQQNQALAQSYEALRHKHEVMQRSLVVRVVGQPLWKFRRVFFPEGSPRYQAYRRVRRQLRRLLGGS